GPRQEKGSQTLTSIPSGRLVSLPRFSLRQSERIQGTASAHHYILPPVEFVSDRSVSHAADVPVPQSRAIAGSQRHHVARDIATDRQSGFRSQHAGRARAIADGVIPDDLARLVIDRS